MHRLRLLASARRHPLAILLLVQLTGMLLPGDPRTWTELTYLGFALLSSAGIGDVIPLTAHARAVAGVEMFVGVIYLAAVVSRLIGLPLPQR